MTTLVAGYMADFFDRLPLQDMFVERLEPIRHHNHQPEMWSRVTRASLVDTPLEHTGLAFH